MHHVEQRLLARTDLLRRVRNMFGKIMSRDRRPRVKVLMRDLDHEMAHVLTPSKPKE